MIDDPLQMTLPLRVRKSSKDAAREDAAELVRALETEAGLCGAPAADVCAALGWTDRRLRAAAEASGGEVLSAPGCRGYRLARRTPVEEYYRVERAHYMSQIEQMKARVCAMDRAVHGAAGRA